ncbi:MAG TPA: adenylate/guanylate cyclase domain-containing protein [Actinomycetes bacterium]|nr:adenylate/guanylate cyclase domain-containing protein [Actinomycetes bacterium]
MDEMLREWARPRPWRQRLLLLHAALYAVVCALGLVLWTLAGRTPDYWFVWPPVVFGLPLAIHASVVWAMGPPAASPPAPTGRMLATVLFTDIVDSTGRARAHGDRRWSQLLDRHDRRARATVEAFGGRLVKTTGDGILATFDGPGRGIRCALALRERLREDGVEVRAGLHTGEVQFRGGDVGGIAVHVAARVMAAAGAGQVLVTRTVQELVAGSDIPLEDRGSHPLRGIAGETRLFAVRVSTSAAAAGSARPRS